MPLERADFVGAIWLTTPILVLLGSKTPRHLRWILLLPFVGGCLLVAFVFPFGPDIAKNYTFGTGWAPNRTFYRADILIALSLSLLRRVGQLQSSCARRPLPRAQVDTTHKRWEETSTVFPLSRCLGPDKMVF